MPSSWTPPTSSRRPEPGDSFGHHLVDGEWVEITVDEHHRYVTPDGEEVRIEELTDFGRYAATAIVDGERVHGYETTALSGEQHDFGGPPRVTFLDADREYVSLGHDLTVVPDYQYTIITEHGVEHRHGRSGVFTVDDDGEAVIAHDRAHPYDIQFQALAEYEGHNAVVGVDGDGEQVLLTRTGTPIEEDVDWSRVQLFDSPQPEGDPIAIGDYLLDPHSTDLERVYLFPDGSQAVKDEGGEFQRVIVPTDAQYPSGRAVFEGKFIAREAGGELDPDAYAVVFSYRDGQTATYADGELMLVDMAIDVDYPEGAPVACGKFPGGELFVFPDGRQLIQANNGTWGIGTLPDLPPYEELVERFGEPDLTALDGFEPPSFSMPDDLLADDITGAEIVLTDPPDPDDPESEPTPIAGDTALADDAGDSVVVTDVVELGDPLAPDVTDLTDPDTGDGLSEVPTELYDDLTQPVDDPLDS